MQSILQIPGSRFSMRILKPLILLQTYLKIHRLCRWYGFCFIYCYW